MKTPQQLENIISTLLDVVDTLVDLEIDKGFTQNGLLNECKSVITNVKHELNTL